MFIVASDKLLIWFWTSKFYFSFIFLLEPMYFTFHFTQKNFSGLILYFLFPFLLFYVFSVVHFRLVFFLLGFILDPINHILFLDYLPCFLFFFFGTLLYFLYFCIVSIASAWSRPPPVSSVTNLNIFVTSFLSIPHLTMKFFTFVSKFNIPNGWSQRLCESICVSIPLTLPTILWDNSN